MTLENKVVSEIDVEREKHKQHIASIEREYHARLNDLHLRIASLERHVDQLLRIIRGLVSLTLAITGRKD